MTKIRQDPGSKLRHLSIQGTSWLIQRFRHFSYRLAASGYVEVLAEVFTFAQNFRSPPNEKIDTFILGAPLWICPTVAEPLSTRSLPPDFETAIEEDESYYNPWQRFRRCVANWIMPSKKFLYANADELTYPELVSTPALTDLAQSWRVINDDQSDS